MNPKLETTENIPDQAGDSLNHVLGILEESGDLYKQLSLKVGDTCASMLSRVIQFGIMNQEGYTYFSSQKRGFFRKLIASLNYTSIYETHGIQLTKAEKDGLGITFEIELTQILIQFEIFWHILNGKLHKKYKSIWQSNEVSMLEDRDAESRILFLQVGNAYFQEICVVEKHYKDGKDYLYFDGGDFFYIFDVEKNKLLEFEGEFESVTEISGKHYIIIQSPNSGNPSKNTLYCIEDEVEYESLIKDISGFILNVFGFQDDIFFVTSDQYQYHGFSKSQKAIKLGNSTKIEKLGEKELFCEQEGVFRDIRIFGDEICLITENSDFYEDKSGKMINTARYTIKYYDNNGYDREKTLSIPHHKIKQTIKTPQDICYIVELEPGKLDIFSLGNSISLSSISGMFPSKITEIIQDSHGALIYFIYPNGKKGFFASAEYPSHYSQ